MSDIVVSNLPVLVDIASVGIQGAQGLQGIQGAVGPTGPQGPQGLPGAAVGIGEAPTDGTIYGRKGNTATWLNVLGLATGGTVSAATTFSSTLAAAGGGSVAGTFSGTPTWSGLHTYTAGLTVVGATALAANNTNFGRGNTYALSGGSLDVTKFGLYVNNNISGTTTNAEIPGAAYIALGSANIAAGPASLIDALNVTMVTGGAAATAGSWNALSVNCNDGALQTNDKATGGAGAFCGIQIARRAVRNQGGTGLTPATSFGANWGMDIVNVASSGATNLNIQNGVEINQSIQSGASIMRRAGLQISSPATHVNRAALWDNAIFVGNAANAATYRAGIMFGDQIAGAVFGSDSAVIAYKAIQAPVPSAVADTGIDFNDVTFTTASLKLPLFKVGPDGTLNISTTYFTPSSTGLAIDAKGAVGTGTPTINAGGSGFSTTAPTPVFDDAYGGVYYGTVTGTAISAVTVIRQPIYPVAGSAPATLALTGRAPTTGTGCVINAAWNTTATTLALQPTTGGKMTMPALQASTTYANDAAAATGGVPVGGVYRNGSVVQVRIA